MKGETFFTKQQYVKLLQRTRVRASISRWFNILKLFVSITADDFSSQVVVFAICLEKEGQEKTMWKIFRDSLRTSLSAKQQLRGNKFIFIKTLHSLPSSRIYEL